MTKEFQIKSGINYFIVNIKDKTVLCENNKFKPLYINLLTDEKVHLCYSFIKNDTAGNYLKRNKILINDLDDIYFLTYEELLKLMLELI